MLGFGRKIANAHEEPLTGQNWAWGTQRDNFHVWAAPSPFLLPPRPTCFFVGETPFPGHVHDVAIKLHLTPSYGFLNKEIMIISTVSAQPRSAFYDLWVCKPSVSISHLSTYCTASKASKPPATGSSMLPLI